MHVANWETATLRIRWVNSEFRRPCVHIPGSSDRQSSLGGSSTDFSNNNALWKTDDAWLAEVEEIDQNIKDLQSSFEFGKMQAFGETTCIFWNIYADGLKQCMILIKNTRHTWVMDLAQGRVLYFILIAQGPF